MTRRPATTLRSFGSSGRFGSHGSLGSYWRALAGMLRRSGLVHAAVVASLTVVALVATLVVAPRPLLAQPAPPDEWAIAAQADRLIEADDYAGASALLTQLERDFPLGGAVHFVRGKYLFHHGHYAEALASLDAAQAVLPSATAISSLRALVASTLEVVKDDRTYTTRDGLFVISYDARDEVLIPWLESTLESAWYEIGYELGYWPEPPIRVEVYGRASTLAAVSSLTEEAIKDSGTIALCKYNKLMLTSPRATARGYDWRTTVAHEYVHYVVSHLTHSPNIPIWLHEAIAKYLEMRWTGSREMVLEPSRAELLSERIAADNLITFEQMHPSMAYLPTQEDAGTAYAQVFTVMEYLVSRRGPGVIRELLYRIRDGAEVIAALTATLGEPFDAFEANWMRALRARPPVEIPGDFEDDTQLIPERGDTTTVDELRGLSSVEARDFLKLGELLRARDLTVAALEEYRKAEVLVGNTNPLVQTALAETLLALDSPAEALTALSDVSRWYPDFYRSHLLRAQALNDLGQPAEALRALDEAVGINPFDPAVHREMRLAWTTLGQADLAARAADFESKVSPP
jgi:tetratricopeptide (TPR) repeat protein